MKKAFRVSLLLLGFILLFYIYVKQDFEQTSPTIYINGTIITLNEKQPIAKAMFVKNGKIIEIGSNKSIKKFESKNTFTVDLKGATVMPGFIDPHTHFSISMFLSEMHDLSGFKYHSNKEVWDSFEDIVKQTNKEDWVICKGIDLILIPDLIPPSINYLDEIAPDIPVLIFSQSLHNYWANSKAFELVGITKETPNPSSHSFYGKDENGNLNGLIVEQQAVKPFFDILKSEVLTPKKLSKVANKVMLDYAKNGNTTIVSTGITIQDKNPLLLFKHLSIDKPELLGSFLEKIGVLPKRKPNPRHFIYIRYDMAHLMPEEKQVKNDFYNIIGIKHWYDGSPYIGSMYLNENYKSSELTNHKLNIPENHAGNALIKKSDLKSFIENYHSKGWQIAMHTQGDAATKEVIDAYEELGNTLDYSSSRHRLEHCLLLSKKDIGRMKNLNLTPSFHMNHLYYYGDALKSSLLGEERTEKILPVASAKNGGLKFSFHADQPMFESNPFKLIQTAIERKTSSGNNIGGFEKIDLMDALKAMTIDAAWQIHMENKIGSLEKGKYADFIILNKNPFETQIKNLSSIKCLKTFINGNLAYKK